MEINKTEVAGNRRKPSTKPKWIVRELSELQLALVGGGCGESSIS